MSYRVWRKKSDNSVVGYCDAAYVGFVPGGDLTTYNDSIEDALPVMPPPDSNLLAAMDADIKFTKATLLVVRQYCNALKAGTYTTKTIQDVKDDFIQAWKSLP